MSRVKLFIKYLLLGTTIILLISWVKVNLCDLSVSPVFALTPTNITQISPTELRNQAQSLTNQGHKLLDQGDPELALKTWQQAMEIYTQLGYEDGIIGSQINQSLALQALGQYRKACNLLLTATKLDYRDRQLCKQPQEREEDKSNSLEEALKKQDTSPVSAIALRTLGDMLRLIGNLNESELVLKKSLEIATQFNLSPEISATQLSLGNTKYALYKINLDLYDRNNSSNESNESNDSNNSIKIAHESLDLYQKIYGNISSLKNTKTEAKLNQLSLLLDMKDWLKKENSNTDSSKLKDELSKIYPQIPPLVDELLTQSDLFSDLPAIVAIYNRLNFALSLQQLQQEDKLSIAIQYAKDALQQAKDIKNQRSEAYALGILGKLYQETDEKLAQQYTENALGIAQSIQALDIAYQWQYQLGQIYEKRGEMKNAIPPYKDAVDTLDLVRKDLLSINTDVQFSFRENVKPIYDKLIGLLLQSEESQDNLQKIIEVNDKLQLAELENFLRCSLQLGKSELINIDRVTPPPAAIFYPILLENRIEVLVKLPESQQIKRYTSPVSQQEFRKTLDELQGRLTNNTNDVNKEILPRSKKLYQWLIQPAASDLPKSGTLVFVLDSTLQSMPFSVLHDGNQYLVEQYSLAVSLGAKLQSPKSLPSGKWDVLLAGVSDKKGFLNNLPPLINVKNELFDIQKTVGSFLLDNEKFTFESFQNQLETNYFAVVHIATHGKFSSDPEKTVIYAWQKEIKVNDFGKLLRRRGEIRSESIELMVLSACQTAEGDKRAALGIAGVALKANAKSVVASLWQVNDASTAEFMQKFYQELNKENMTKAKALQEVQISFIHGKYYDHPYYWSPFILAGNWL